MLGANLAGATLDYPQAYAVSDWDPGPSSAEFGRVSFAGVNLNGATLPAQLRQAAPNQPRNEAKQRHEAHTQEGRMSRMSPGDCTTSVPSVNIDVAGVLWA